MAFIGRNNAWPNSSEVSEKSLKELNELPKKSSPWQYKGLRELDETKLIHSNGMLNLYTTLRVA